MRSRKLLFLVLCWFPMSAALSTASDHRVASTAEYVFEDSAGTRKGGYISFLDLAPRGNVELSLIETPAGSRLVVTSALNPVAGRHRVRVADETTGWWAELVTTTAEKAQDVDEYLAKGLGSDLLDRGEVEIRLRGDARFTTSLRVEDGDTAAPTLAQLRQRQAVRALAEQIPESVRGSLLLLDSLPRLVSQDFDRASPEEIESLSRHPTPPAATLVRLLSLALREAGLAPRAEPPSLIAREVTRHPGPSVQSPEQLEFVSRFETVESPADPLPEVEVLALLSRE
jgi:hypothetical protein